jgi:hypothetical protein
MVTPKIYNLQDEKSENKSMLKRFKKEFQEK